jgi:hypothetical protein
MWSAATCRRFGLRRLDAAFFDETQPNPGRDKSRPYKALTSQRTPETGTSLKIRSSSAAGCPRPSRFDVEK